MKYSFEITVTLEDEQNEVLIDVPESMPTKAALLATMHMMVMCGLEAGEGAFNETLALLVAGAQGVFRRSPPEMRKLHIETDSIQ